VFLIVLVLIAIAIFYVVRRRRGGRGGGGGFGQAASATAGGYGSGSGPGSAGGPGPGAVASTAAPWTGSQEAAINSIRGALFPDSASDAHSAASPVQEGLAEIKAHDPAFNEETFLESVQRAFFVVQEAWTDRKPEMSRQVMADGIWQQHRVQIQQYVSEHKRNVLEDLAVGDLSILSAHSDQTYDTITTRVLAACADYDVNDANNKVIRGNKSVGQWQEDWTWQRSSQATTKVGGGTLSAKCPNCGAPLNLDLQGVCKFCHQPIMSGKYDWVLARIAQVNV
jgi:predicted lipid-binding transport protein (Tim44 family)